MVEAVRELIRGGQAWQKEVILVGVVAEFVRKWPRVVARVKHLF